MSLWAEGRIASVSTSHPGSRHDLSIRREGAKLPHSARLYADSAYQGYEREHAAVELPYKKRKGAELSADEKDYNRGLGSFRVAVEHRIGRTFAPARHRCNTGPAGAGHHRVRERRLPQQV